LKGDGMAGNANTSLVFQHYRAVYGRAADEDDGLVCLYNGKNSWFCVPRDTETLVRWTEGFDGLPSGPDFYHLVNLLDPAAVRGIRERHGRGKESEIRSVVALVADVDAGKLGRNYPSQELAINALLSMPLKPSIVNLSGRADGGLHAFWLFPAPFRIEGPESLARVKSVSQRWQALLRGKLRPYDLDSTYDQARVLRPAGTTNHKYGTLVRPIIFEPDRRYALGEFESALPPLPPPDPQSNGRRLAGFPSDYERGNVVERARRYVAKIPGAVSGEHGHNRTFRVACALVLGFDLLPADALPVLAEWNRTCDPPWTHAELMHKLDGADSRPDQRGYLLDPRRYDKGAAVAGAAGGDAPRSLEDYRKEMLRARLDSLLVPGIYFDGSPTGAGKSFADIESARAAGSSLTVLPSHSLCEETEAAYNQAGLPAAAYPRLNGETCQNLTEANRAIAAGLSASGSVCLTCRFNAGCDYRDAMKKAEAAIHRIATHKRTELSFQQIAKGCEYITIHEDPLTLFRPTIEVSAAQLETVAAVAQHAKDDGRERRDETAYHFFWKMEDGCHWLIEAVQQAGVTKNLPLPVAAGKPGAADSDLWRSMIALGKYPDGDAMRLVKAVAAGELAQLDIRVDEVFAAGRELEIHKALVGTWQTKIPGGAVVWINDATADRQAIEDVLGMPVIDRTPRGTLARQQRVVQIPVDVTQGTGVARLLVVVKAVLREFSGFYKIGIVCHKKHAPVLKGTAKRAPVLDEAARRRISKIEYFRGGQSRGSNNWTQDCDFLMVVGTPRVPPSAIRTHLLRIGKHRAAALDVGGQIRTPQTWTGTTEAGRPVKVTVKGYGDPDWASAHRTKVHGELMQAVGRARYTLTTGIPAVVLTTENLGFPILELEIDGGRINDSDNLVLSAIGELSAIPATSERESEGGELSAVSAKYILAKPALSSPFRPVRPSEIQARTKIPYRTVISILKRLLGRSQVVKHGKRKGWTLAVDPAAVAVEWEAMLAGGIER
jgi:hypothetical protein